MDLPDEVVETILASIEFSKGREIVNVACVSKQFSQVLNSGRAWRELAMAVIVVFLDLFFVSDSGSALVFSSM
jgi:hypothetical protein